MLDLKLLHGKQKSLNTELSEVADRWFHGGHNGGVQSWGKKNLNLP